MSLRDLVRFAVEALRGHRLRSGLSVLGVAIGVASVIILTSLGDGARLYVIGEFAELGTNLLVVFPGRTETTGAMPLFGGVPNDLTLDDMEDVRRRVPQVRRIAPLAFGEAKARYRDKAKRVTVVGTTAEMREIRHLDTHAGRFLPPGDPRSGQRVAVVGSKLAADLFDGDALGKVMHVGESRFRVIGVIAPRGVALGMNMDEVVEIPVSQALRLFNQTSLFRLLVEARSHAELRTARAGVLEVLTERHGEEDVTVVTQDAVVGAFDAILGVLTAAIAGIAAISLSVAGIAIMNVMLVSVTERTPEVGLLKALGATRGQVTAAFLVEAALLSTTGGVVGLALGFMANDVLRMIWPSFPVHAPAWAVLASLVVSIVVGLAFGALPARRAARLDPVAALARR